MFDLHGGIILGPESRNVALVLGGSFLTIGALLWVTLHSYGWIPGGILLALGVLVFSSLLWGWPSRSLRADVRQGSLEGIPTSAPIEYQVRQLRQVIPWFQGEPFGPHDLYHAMPKVTRTGQLPLYEPMTGLLQDEAFERLVASEELEVVSPLLWRATGTKPTKHWFSRK